MSRTTPTIHVKCDKCGYLEEELELREVMSMENDLWSDRSVNQTLENWKWDISGGEDLCPECVQEIEEENDESEDGNEE